MSILTILIVVLVAALVLWLINAYLPVDVVIKRILSIVIFIVLLLWMLGVFGVRVD